MNRSLLLVITLLLIPLFLVSCDISSGTIPSQEDFSKLKPGEIVEHPSTANNPYYFYTYFPKSALSKKDITLIVWGHGAGDKEWTGSMESYKEGARNRLGSLTSYAEEYGVPILIVAVPNSLEAECHKMTEETFTTNNELFYRPDLKVIDAIWNQYIPFLESLGFSVDKKICMLGFSGSGIFSYRFTMVHPDRVKALWMGGGTVFPLPVKTYQGVSINWPVGINDFKALTGKNFDMNTYIDIPIYVERGENDTNTVNSLEYLSQEELDFVNRYFGTTENERTKKAVEFDQSLGMKISYHEYPGLGHEITDQMLEDAFDFLTAH